MDLTEWFPAGVKPYYVGDYLASYTHKYDLKRHWDGKFWSLSFTDKYNAADKEAMRKLKDAYQNDICWRGLSSKP